MNMQTESIKIRQGAGGRSSRRLSSFPLIGKKITDAYHSVIWKDVRPFVLWLVWLLALTLIVDYLLHQTEAGWIERYSGVIGTLLIVLSFAYSLRKKKIITVGKPRNFLRIHEYLAWTGSLMILVHGGIHFNGIVAWTAVAAMFVAVISGLVGKYLLKQSINTLNARKDKYTETGLSEEEIEKRIFWDSLTVSVMKKWKTAHRPITIVFGITAVLHIVTILLFWRWN